jgi:hypothetical protein
MRLPFALIASCLTLSLFPAIEAAALPSCVGSYAATAIRPLPARMAVSLDVRDRSPRNLRLADHSLEGLRNAGVSVASPPNVVLHVRTSRLDDGATVQCQMVGSDEDRLAQELGKVIGGALGQRIERQPL